MCHIHWVHGGPLDLRSFAALEALVEHQSVSKAAAALGVTQPTMSRTLARLRAALGDELLVRAGSKMIPTPRAIELARAAGRAMQQFQRALEGETFDPATSTKRFRIAAWDYCQELLLPALISRLRAAAPASSLEVVPVLARSPIESLDAGDIDVSVGLHRQVRDGYHRRTLFSDAFVVCAREEHPIWDLPMTAERFAAAAHLLVAPFGATRRGAVDLALQAIGLSREVAAFVPNFAAAPALLRGTDLVATLPRLLVRNHDEALRFAEPPLPMPQFDIEAVWHGTTHADAAHAWFREQLRGATHHLRDRPSQDP